jgi:hypothetical protein
MVPVLILMLAMPPRSGSGIAWTGRRVCRAVVAAGREAWPGERREGEGDQGGRQDFQEGHDRGTPERIGPVKSP